LFLALIACLQIKIDKKVSTAKIVRYSTIIKQSLRAYSSNKLLLKFIILGGLFSMWGNMLFVYYQPYFVRLHVSTSTLGILFAVISLGSALGSMIMKRLPNKMSAAKIQSVELLVVIVTALLLMGLHLPLLLGAPLVLSVISGFQYPNMRIFVNNITADNVRTSVLSVASSVYTAGLVIGLFISYYMADHLTKNQTLTVIIIGTTITLIANPLLLPSTPNNLSKKVKLIPNS
jgi:MFS family permease